MQPAKIGTGQIAKRNIMPHSGFPKRSNGGIELRSGGFVAGKRGDTGSIESVEADVDQPIPLHCNPERCLHPSARPGSAEGGTVRIRKEA